MPFGQHCMIDLYDCDETASLDMNIIFRFLDSLPNYIDMIKIMPPHVVIWNDKNPLDSGISAFVMISTSHISLHSFPHRNGFISADVYSCKPFDTQEVISRFVDTFKAKKVELNVVERGFQFSRDLQKIEEHVILT